MKDLFGYVGKDTRPEKFRRVSSLPKLTQNITRVDKIDPVYSSSQERLNAVLNDAVTAITELPTPAIRKSFIKEGPQPYVHSTPVDVDVVSTPNERLHSSKLTPKIQRTSDLNGPVSPDAHVVVENLIDVPIEQLEKVTENIDTVTEQLSELFLKEGAPMMIGFDNASAYTEAALKDGLGIDADIDDEVLPVLERLLQANVVSFFANKMSYLSAEHKNLFVQQFISKAVEDLLSEAKKRKLSQKYSQQLRNLAARITDGQNNAIGVKKSRKDDADDRKD